MGVVLYSLALLVRLAAALYQSFRGASGPDLGLQSGRVGDLTQKEEVSS